MKLTTRTTTQGLPKSYLEVLNGTLKLTDKEVVLGAAIISRYLELSKEGLIEPFLSKLVFSTEERKSLCENMDGLSPQNLGNKLKQLVNKKVLIMDKDDNYTLNRALLPDKELIFKFIVDDTSPGKGV